MVRVWTKNNDNILLDSDGVSAVQHLVLLGGGGRVVGGAMGGGELPPLLRHVLVVAARVRRVLRRVARDGPRRAPLVNYLCR